MSRSENMMENNNQIDLKNVIKILRTYESLKTKLMKAEADIQFIKSCKKR